MRSWISVAVATPPGDFIQPRRGFARCAARFRRAEASPHSSLRSLCSKVVLRSASIAARDIRVVLDINRVNRVLESLDTAKSVSRAHPFQPANSLSLSLSLSLRSVILPRRGNESISRIPRIQIRISRARICRCESISLLLHLLLLTLRRNLRQRESSALTMPRGRSEL